MSQPARLRISRHTRTRSRADRTVVFHELRPQPFEVPAELWQEVQRDVTAAPAWLLDKLSRQGLLASDVEDDTVQAEARGALNRRLDATTLLYLVLVQDCNFGCSYCPIPALASQQGHKRMSVATIRAAVDTWQRHVQDVPPDSDLGVIFYGGEPLLNEEALRAGLEYVAELQAAGQLPPERLHLMVCTNGTLLTDEHVALFTRYEISVAVGCDGPAPVHDTVRRTTDGSATFTQVASAIKRLVTAGVTTYVSTSVTPANVDQICGFTAFFRSLGVTKFGFNLLRGKLLFSLVDPDGLDDYHRRAVDGIVANLLGGGDPRFEYQAEHRLDAIAHGQFFPVDCNAYGNQLVIDPNGAIGNCPFTPGDLGNVHTISPDFRIAATDKARRLRQELPLFNPECEPCDAKAICGGGCRWNVRELVDGDSTIDPGPCLLTRRLFDEAIWNPELVKASRHD